MKEIKFRGLSIKEEWHIGNVAILKEQSYSVPAGTYISNSIGNPYAYSVRPETVGQFVELKDKNGIEIYEGDILQSFPNNDTKFEVCFGWNTDRNAYGWCLKSLQIDKTYAFDNSYLKMAVVGNIHENQNP